MNQRIKQGGVEYRIPACSFIEISQEGMLCASFTHESFTTGEDGAGTYGRDLDNNGWF